MVPGALRRIIKCRRRSRLLVLVLTLPLLGGLLTVFGTQYSLMQMQDDDVLIPLRSDNDQKEYIDRRGIHVVVGHFHGDELPWITSPNLTDEVLNANNYEPIRGAGEMGQGVQTAGWESNKMRKLFHINRFNLLASDRISINRSLPDVRRQSCTKREYKKLPSTSIIIVFHNEAWSTLLRTVHSAINRSPRHLLKEIILVDDASERKFLKKPLDEHVSKLSVTVRIIRSVNRTGLIRARMLGADIATGDVLTFLDAHCECTEGWLTALLEPIAKDRRNVVCPVIDIVHDETLAYIRSFELHWGAFNWDLHFRWYPLGNGEIKKRKSGSSDPFRTPVMAGGLFAIDKSYFVELGSYDEKMDIWGGENLELSFRVWQCGGKVLIAPCSHVGHIFRKTSPYTYPRPGGVGSVLNTNLARVAKVWLDEYSNFYFGVSRGVKKFENETDVSERRSLRESLKCKSFKWYLDNVWPENFMPAKDRFFGRIINKKAGTCFERPRSKSAMSPPIGVMSLKQCVIESYPEQFFLFTPKGFIMTDENTCLDAFKEEADTYVRLATCTEYPRQKWTYNPQLKSVMHKKSGLCMDLPTKSSPDGLTLQKCSAKPSQQWAFEAVDWQSGSMEPTTNNHQSHR